MQWSGFGSGSKKRALEGVTENIEILLEKPGILLNEKKSPH
jgi:hypothetical protein